MYAQHTFAWSAKQVSNSVQCKHHPHLFSFSSATISLSYGSCEPFTCFCFFLVSITYHPLLRILHTSAAIVRFIKPKIPHVGTLAGKTRAFSQDMKFDYRIAQASIFLDAISYVLTIIAPASSEVLFVGFTSLSSFTAGVNPAIHSLAVSYLYAFSENANVGQMFGGMSMLQAISHTLQASDFPCPRAEDACLLSCASLWCSGWCTARRRRHTRKRSLRLRRDSSCPHPLCSLCCARM